MLGKNLITRIKNLACAQEIEILNNLNDAAISPWYVVKSGDVQVQFPQWTFTTTELKRFQ